MIRVDLDASCVRLMDGNNCLLAWRVRPLPTASDCPWYDKLIATSPNQYILQRMHIEKMAACRPAVVAYPGTR